MGLFWRYATKPVECTSPDGYQYIQSFRADGRYRSLLDSIRADGVAFREPLELALLEESVDETGYSMRERTVATAPGHGPGDLELRVLSVNAMGSVYVSAELYAGTRLLKTYRPA